MEGKKEMVFKLLMKNLDKKSSFFKDDLQSLRERIDEKTEEEIEETLLRWRTIMTTTDAEINKNCRFR